MVDFSSLLNKQMGTIEAPKNFPAGSYNLIVKERSFDVSQQKQTPYVRFVYAVVSPGGDVDQDAWAAANIDLSKRTLRDDFYLTEDALYRLSEHLQNVFGLSPDINLQQAVEMVVGKPCVGHVVETLNKRDPSRPFNEIKSYSRAE